MVHPAVVLAAAAAMVGVGCSTQGPRSGTQFAVPCAQSHLQPATPSHDAAAIIWLIPSCLIPSVCASAGLQRQGGPTVEGEAPAAEEWAREEGGGGEGAAAAREEKAGWEAGRGEVAAWAEAGNSLRCRGGAATHGVGCLATWLRDLRTVALQSHQQQLARDHATGTAHPQTRRCTACSHRPWSTPCLTSCVCG